jgi:hypothetical protein
VSYWAVIHAIALVVGLLVFAACAKQQTSALQRVATSIYFALTVMIAVLLVGNGVAAWASIPRPLYLQGTPEFMILFLPGVVTIGLLLLTVPYAAWYEWRAGTLTSAKSILDGVRLLCVAGAWLVAAGILMREYLWSLDVKTPNDWCDQLITQTYTYDTRSRRTGTYDVSNYVPGGAWSLTWQVIKIGLCLFAGGGVLLLLVALQRRAKRWLATWT